MHKFFLTALLAACGWSCTKVVDATDVDVPTISYQNDIAPLIAANCTQSGCHGDVQTEEFNLLSYGAVNRLVSPGKPHSSELYEVIRLYSGEKAMPPKPNQPLSDYQIGQIYVWILQGALDN